MHSSYDWNGCKNFWHIINASIIIPKLGYTKDIDRAQLSELGYGLTTIPSTLFLTCSRACPRLLPHFSHYSLENEGKTGRSVGEILD
jgi:hypothetical protein